MRYVDKLEAVQWRATKVLKCLQKMLKEERLKDLGLFSLQKRKLRMHLIAVFHHLKRGHRGDSLTQGTSNRTEARGCKLQQDTV